MMKKAFLALALSSTICLTEFAAVAQDTGRHEGTYIQGRRVDGGGTELLTGPREQILDHKEEMRGLVEDIGNYARKHKKNFGIVAMNAGDLMQKTAAADDTKAAPARAFLRSVDGIFQEGLNFGLGAVDQPPEADLKKRIDDMLKLAKANGLPVFVIDYAQKKKNIRASYKINARNGYVSYVAPAKGEELNRIADTPARPMNENSRTVLSLNDVRNFVFLRDTAGFGRQDEFALKMHDTNYDLVIVDVFHGRSPLSRRAVETLKYKKAGGKRLVYAYLDVGSAASYHYYWKPHWREGSPSWIGQPLPNNPDKYTVEYWNPGWKKILSGNTKSYVYGLVAQGFDGVLLDGLTAATYFASGEEGDLSTTGSTGFIR